MSVCLDGMFMKINVKCESCANAGIKVVEIMWSVARNKNWSKITKMAPYKNMLL